MNIIPNKKYNNLQVKLVQNSDIIKHNKNNTFNFGGKVLKIGESNGVNQTTYAEVQKYLPKKTRIALDIGARWGEWTKMLQKNFIHVYAFEPLQKRYKQIASNCFVNNITLYGCCLGEVTETVNMYGGCIFDDKISNIDAMTPRKDKLSLRPSIRLDDLKIGKVDFIKIDVEGYELPVLKGGIETIKKWKPIICLEQNGSETKWRGAKKNEALEYLLSIGMVLEKQLNDQDYLFLWPKEDNTKIERKPELAKSNEEELL